MAQSADMTVTSVIIRIISQHIDKSVSVYQSSSVSLPHVTILTGKTLDSAVMTTRAEK
jgi:hypothetical protein